MMTILKTYIIYFDMTVHKETVNFISEKKNDQDNVDLTFENCG